MAFGHNAVPISEGSSFRNQRASHAGAYEAQIKSIFQTPRFRKGLNRIQHLDSRVQDILVQFLPHQLYKTSPTVERSDRSLGCQPFQCTFCLTQCTTKQDWIQHERSTHFQEQEWTNNLDDRTEEQDSRTTRSFTGDVGRTRHPSRRNSHTHSSRRSESRKSSNRSHLEHKDDWFWNCGFCNTLLRSWDERQEHIADEHFEKGMTMSSWNPLKSPYPWRRGSATPVPGLPYWDLTALLAIQRPSLIDSINE